MSKELEKALVKIAKIDFQDWQSFGPHCKQVWKKVEDIEEYDLIKQALERLEELETPPTEEEVNEPKEIDFDTLKELVKHKEVEDE
jgi:hypothetical protein